jgi:hypothetical protein
MSSYPRLGKVVTAVVLAFLLALGLSVKPTAAVLIHDEPSGFRGNHWGDAPENCAAVRFVKGLGLTQSGKQVDLYDRSPVGITLNGVSFTRIHYRFLDNRLESVQLSYEGREGYHRLRQLMEERYGRLAPGERQLTTRAEWNGFESTVVLSFNPGTGSGSLWFLSTVLNREFSHFAFWTDTNTK